MIRRISPRIFSIFSTSLLRSALCFVVGLAGFTRLAVAQSESHKQSRVTATEAANAPTESHLEHYLKFAHPIGSAKLEFPGPYGGYMFAHFKVHDIGEAGDTTWRDRPFLIDMNLSHDGTYLAPDTLKTYSDFMPFEFPMGGNHLIHAKLAPTHSREELRGFDSLFAGSLGYGLFRNYVTTFDFKKNELTFYPLYANISIGDQDPNVIHLPLLDDAVLTYCHCPYPTIWIEAEAPPLRAGRVQLATQEPLSQVFTSSMDAETDMLLKKQAVTDPKTGQKDKVGLNLGKFIIGGENIAKRSPHRAVDALPAAFHDLSVQIMGTLGNDVLRTFSALIIDPSRSAIYLVK